MSAEMTMYFVVLAIAMVICVAIPMFVRREAQQKPVNNVQLDRKWHELMTEYGKRKFQYEPWHAATGTWIVSREVTQ